MAQKGWRLEITRDYLFTGNLDPIKRAVIVGPPEYALHKLQSLIDAAEIKWAQTGEPLNLTAYAMRGEVLDPAEFKDEAHMQDYIWATVVDFYTDFPRDGLMWLEEMDVYLFGG